ncbi:AAA family ATPase [Roseibacillus ishigakijimensis]|uniref:AAA family ATPase n=1 Tax=Roseibacillus ishigakijimensis TaxID=454146 RepID=A0A934RMI0_9BACT|nr:AAA family ATPase [Roseibacillus ishigakijimensis]MBK1834119.1 AAA family ATPase [Roseibacillus ishigakijimensis]
MEHASESEIASASRHVRSLAAGLNEVIYGQEELVDLVVIGLLARGHILLEGLPGLGKTELVKTLSKLLSLDTKRVQFTPDLLPGDITGNPVLQETEGRREFVFQPGPLFTNLCLADEINRASPKTQSALLEAMQERRVTVLGTTHDLPRPFFVLATQNPIELEGTYPLPEAQLDRFLFKLEVTRNSVDTLQRIITTRDLGQEPEVRPLLKAEELEEVLALVRRIYLPDVVANYIARLVDATHPGQSTAASAIKYGASPRAALSLASAARARALLQERTHTSFEDVRFVAPAVLRHRILLEYNARVEGLTNNDLVARILAEVPTQSEPLPKTLQSQ